jgi:hypothetical protein
MVALVGTRTGLRTIIAQARNHGVVCAERRRPRNEGLVGLNRGIEDPRQLVARAVTAPGRAEFGAHAAEEVAQ